MTTTPQRLRAAMASAERDDHSKPHTNERQRHLDRVQAMYVAAEELDRLQAGWRPISEADSSVRLCADAAMKAWEPGRPRVRFGFGLLDVYVFWIGPDGKVATWFELPRQPVATNTVSPQEGS